MIPIKIWLLSKIISVVDYDKEYPDRPKTINESKGEIEKFKTQEPAPKFNKRVVGVQTIKGIEFDVIWHHIGDNWFKIVSKVR